MIVQEKLKLVTVLGAGLLCGTALAVIIPEGVHALYEEILEGRAHRCLCGSLTGVDMHDTYLLRSDVERHTEILLFCPRVYKNQYV